MYDEILNLRSNFQCISKHNNNFPIKSNEVYYTKEVLIIRDEQLNAITDFNNMFIIPFITILSNNENYTYLAYKYNNSDNDSNDDSDTDTDKNIKKTFTLKTYSHFKEKIELIFQTAHKAENDIIIFNDFGCLIDELPINDIIDIFNLCILKYGHLFKQIIFALNVYTQKGEEIFNIFNNKILKPQDIVLDNNTEDEEIINMLKIIK
jgi:hypothetical protein